jgi:hypothetical protein
LVQTLQLKGGKLFSNFEICHRPYSLVGKQFSNFEAGALYYKYYFHVIKLQMCYKKKRFGEYQT